MFRAALMLTLTGLAFTGSAEDGVDSRIKPGDDFFTWANGDWLAAARIPQGKGRWGARNEIAARAEQQLAEVIREAPAGKVADFHAAYLDQAGIEGKGIAPIAALLRSIDALHDKTDLARWLGSHLPADVDPLGTGVVESAHPFGLAVSFGIHGEPDCIAYLVQGGVSHAGRERVARALQGAGFNQPEQRADGVLALEAAIARSHATAAQSGDERNADNRWRRADFPKQAPGMNWAMFFEAAGLSKQREIVAWQPSAVRGIAALVASEPLPVWKNYLRFHVVHRYADVLPRSMAEPSPIPREQRAIAATNQALPEAVGRLYVERYFPAASKAKAQAIVDRVVAAFRRRVAQAPWLTAGAKDVALTKLKVMYFGVGYPERWQDDSKLRIEARDPVGNLQRVAEWNYRKALAKLGQPVDRREWAISPQSPGGLLNFQLNSYNFTAALLQPPRFDIHATDAANYGSIGAIFAHEISHFVDTLGAEYDARGDLRNWWGPQDKAQFATALQPLVDQFSAYRPLAGVAVDGRLTLTENVADLGGVATAFDAYRDALEGWASTPDQLRLQDRQFFIGFARSWRSKMTDEALRTHLKNDGHAPDPEHVSTVRNLDAWYEAFDVQPGERLYLPPGSRVRIW